MVGKKHVHPFENDCLELQVVAGRFDDFDVLLSRIPAENHSQVPKCQGVFSVLGNSNKR